MLTAAFEFDAAARRRCWSSRCATGSPTANTGPRHWRRGGASRGGAGGAEEPAEAPEPGLKPVGPCTGRGPGAPQAALEAAWAAAAPSATCTTAPTATWSSTTTTSTSALSAESRRPVRRRPRTILTSRTSWTPCALTRKKY